jgi:AraC family transcriptional regulator
MCTVVTLDPIKVIAVRKKGPYQQSAQVAWKALLEFAQPRQLIDEKTQMLGISYDDPQIIKPEDLRYDAAISLDEKAVQVEGEVKVQEVAGGDYVILFHVGSFNGLMKAYGKAFAWMQENGKKYREGVPCFEKYIDYTEKTKEEDLKTEIHIPVE